MQSTVSRHLIAVPSLLINVDFIVDFITLETIVIILLLCHTYSWFITSE